MIESAREIPPHCVIETEICVVGAGAAGLALANALDNSRQEVLLLESGGLQQDTRAQELSAGPCSGESYSLDRGRVRAFGGTTHKWGGMCVPLDEIDFEARDWLPHSGWPIAMRDLARYYERAGKLLALPSLDESELPDSLVSTWERLISKESGLAAGRLLRTPVLRFGRVFRPRIRASRNIRAILNANATELIANPGGSRIELLQAETLGGKRFSVRARHFVLAAGAIENARLLLVSNRSQPAGLGNARGLVGRYFMEHYFLAAGIVRAPGGAPDPSAFANWRPYGNAAVCGWLHVPESRRRQLHLSGAQFRMIPVLDREGASGVGAYKTLKYLLGERQFQRLRFHQVRQMLRGGPDVARYLFHRATVMLSAKARARTEFLLRCAFEMRPEAENRVTLSEEKDCLGRRRAALHFRINGQDWESYRKSLAIVAQGIERTGLKFLPGPPPEPLPEAIQDTFGFHQMGATRMSDCPSRGVADRHCRVHETANLYVAGSSVFPTGGSANPTLTIVALALRLADHLRSLRD